MTKLKILNLIASLNHGGAETLALNLSDELSRLNCESYLCAFGNNVRGDSNNLAWKLDDLSCHVQVIPTSGLYKVETYQKVADFIQSQGIHLIHTHLSDADILGNLIGWHLNIPVITTLHNLSKDYHEQRKSRSLPVRYFVKNKAAKLIAISNTIRSEFLSAWDLNANRIHTIPNAIDLSEFSALSAKPNASNDPSLIVTTVGRLEPQKAQHIFLKAAYQVLQQGLNIKFQIIGDGSLRMPLEKQSEELGLKDHVHFLGLRDDIPNLLAKSDIFVLSSLWEGLPISAIEAMAAGCALVLTDVGGSRDLIKDGEDGVLVAPNQPNNLADAIKLLAIDHALRSKMSERASKKAKQEFDIATSAEKHLELYKRVWTKKKGVKCVSQ